MHKKRLDNLRSLLTAKNIDSLFVTDLSNIFYLSGFTGSSGGLFVTLSDAYILVDSRYTVQAANECKNCRVVEYSSKTLCKATAELIGDIKPGVVGYEAEHISVSYFRQFRRNIPKQIKLKSTSGFVENLRAVKDDYEISLIRNAASITDATFSTIIGTIKIGMTESEVASLIDFTMRNLGADREAFETIAACGTNAAKPHATPSSNKIKNGNMLKLDFGAKFKHYCSDITRTIFLGKATYEFKDIYSIVKVAQEKAIDAIKPGILGSDIDSIARNYIASKGYGDNFGHGLGHALGPAFTQSSKLILKPGMVVTVEPGIYIEGWGGIRIEDDVLITDTGYEIITKSTKDILSIQ